MEREGERKRKREILLDTNLIISPNSDLQLA